MHDELDEVVYRAALRKYQEATDRARLLHAAQNGRPPELLDHELLREEQAARRVVEKRGAS